VVKKLGVLCHLFAPCGSFLPPRQRDTAQQITLNHADKVRACLVLASAENQRFMNLTSHQNNHLARQTHILIARQNHKSLIFNTNPYQTSSKLG
jgi:hypothetical protein